MHTYEFETVNDMFVGMAQNLLKYGNEVSPRDKKTLELYPCHISILNPSNSIVIHPLREMRYDFLIMEPLWILSGDEEPWIINYLKNMDRFTNIVDGRKRLMGGYGPRIRHHFGFDQLQYVIDTLNKDRDTRQAIITISDPTVDHNGYNDFPCTQSLHFLVRNDRLNLITTMRSNDWWLGAVYDFFLFNLLLHIVSSITKIPVGTYFHNATSFHVYETHFGKLKMIVENPKAKITDINIPSLSTLKYDSLDEVYEDASYGKNLKTSNILPLNDRYLTRLMRYVLSPKELFKSSQSVV